MKKGHSLAICGPPINRASESGYCNYGNDTSLIGAGFGGQASVQDVAAPA